MFGLSKQFFAAGILATSTAFAEEAPTMKYTEIAAEKNYSINDMNMSVVALSQSDENGVLRETIGLYDKVVGLSCEWVQETKERDGDYWLKDTKIVHQACALGDMPKAWQEAESQRIEDVLYDAGKKSFEGEFQNVERFSGLLPSMYSPEITTIMSFGRAWNKSTREVCLQSFMGEIDNSQPQTPVLLGSLAVDHGCYQLKDYAIKSAIAFQIGQAI